MATNLNQIWKTYNERRLAAVDAYMFQVLAGEDDEDCISTLNSELAEAYDWLQTALKTNVGGE